MAIHLSANRPIAPGDEEHREIETVYEHIKGGQPQGKAKLIGPDGKTVSLPPSLYRVLETAVEVLRRGEAVSVIPIHKELGTEEAANILNISRQYLVRLLEEGRIPFTKAGTHRRIKLGDLMRFKHQRDELREQKLDELTQLSDDLGLY